MELRRVLGRKVILILCASVLLNLFIFMYLQIGKHTWQEKQAVNQAYAQMLTVYEDMDFDQALTQLQQLYLDAKNENTDGNLEAIQLMQAKITHLNEYKSTVHQIIQNAANLQTLSIFTNVNSYSYHNIVQTAKDFENVSSLSLSLDNDRAVESVSTYTFLYYLAFADFVVLLYVMLLERENGMWQLLHTMPYGRNSLAWKRVTMITGISFFQLLILFLSTVITSLILYGGWSDLTRPVQTLNQFTKFSYLCSKLEYLVILFLMSWFVLWSLTMIVWLFFVMTRNRNLAVAIMCGIFGVEVLLYQNISVQSAYNWLKYLNILNLFQISQVLCAYRNWGFGTFVWSVWKSVLVLCLLFLVLSSVLSILSYGRMRPGKTTGLLTKFTSYIARWFQWGLCKSPQVCKEIYKLFTSGKALYLIVGVIVASIYFAASNRMYFTENELEIMQLYETSGGEDYIDLQELVEEKQQNKAQAEQEFTSALKQKKAGTMEIEEFNSYYASYTMATEEWKSVSDIFQKISYLEEMKEEYGIDGYLMSDCGYEEILGEYSIRRELILVLILISTIVLAVSANVTIEFTSGMSAIVRGSCRGRAWAFAEKVLASVWFASLLFLIMYGVDFIYMNYYYGFPYLSAPVMSLTFLRGYEIHTSILGYIVLQLGIRFSLCLFGVGAAMLISLMLGRKGNKSIMIGILIFMIFATLWLINLSGKIAIMVATCVLVAAILLLVAAHVVWSCKYQN